MLCRSNSTPILGFKNGLVIGAFGQAERAKRVHHDGFGRSPRRDVLGYCSHVGTGYPDCAIPACNGGSPCSGIDRTLPHGPGDRIARRRRWSRPCRRTSIAFLWTEVGEVFRCAPRYGQPEAIDLRPRRRGGFGPSRPVTKNRDACRGRRCSRRKFLTRLGQRREYEEQLSRTAARADNFRNPGKNNRDQQNVYEKNASNGDHFPFVIRQRSDVRDIDQRDRPICPAAQLAFATKLRIHPASLRGQTRFAFAAVKTASRSGF